jgi:hypothetical protein
MQDIQTYWPMGKQLLEGNQLVDWKYDPDVTPHLGCP